MIIFVHFYFPFSVHCYIIIYRSRKYQEISHGNDESIKSNSSSSRENRQTELEGQSKTICNSNGNNARSNIDNSRSIPVNKPNKVRDWDMER